MRTSQAFGALLAIVLAISPAPLLAQSPDGAAAAAGNATPFAASPDAAPAKAGKAAKSGAPKGAAALQVGDIAPDAHIVTEPGRYGLSNPPAGEAYAVVGKSLVRIDPGSKQVLSILRQIEGLRD